MTIKRDSVGDLYIIVVTDANTQPEISTTTGQTAGFDFGLKTFLTVSDGTTIESPQFFKTGQKEVRKANQNLSRKKKGIRNL